MENNCNINFFFVVTVVNIMEKMYLTLTKMSFLKICISFLFFYIFLQWNYIVKITWNVVFIKNLFLLKVNSLYFILYYCYLNEYLKKKKKLINFYWISNWFVLWIRPSQIFMQNGKKVKSRKRNQDENLL